MFDRTTVFASHIAVGGGAAPERRTTNPAWDFQCLIPEYDVNEAV